MTHSRNRYKMIASVYLVIFRDGKIPLLLRQNTSWMNGYYGLIAGHVEPDETMREAMVREAKEEAGIVLQVTDLQLIYVSHSPDFTSPGDERLDFFFQASDWQGEVVNAEPEKCSEIGWFSPDNLPVNTIDNIKDLFKHYQTSMYGEFDWDAYRSQASQAQ